MSEVLVRDNGDSYDVLVKNATKEEATALREAFSAVDENRAYAQQVSGSLLQAFRNNSVMSSLHEDYKTNIRDVAKVNAEPDDADDDSGENDEFDGFVA